MSQTASQNSRKSTGLKLAIIPLVMLGASFAAIPLYNYVCAVTGFGGTPQVAQEESNVATGTFMNVRFSGTVANNLPWEFRPVEPHLKIEVGETYLVEYEAYNNSDEELTGYAVFNVAPPELGGYFNKIECFCFTEQTLKPHERVRMPVTFYVDPEMVKDPDTKDIKELTLAYSFNLSDSKTGN